MSFQWPSLLWALLAVQCIQDVITAQHYSVDMFLGVVVTWLVWARLEPLCPPARKVIFEYRGYRRPPTPILLFIAFSIAVGGVIVILGRA